MGALRSGVCKLDKVVVRDQIATAAENLPELDEGWSSSSRASLKRSGSGLENLVIRMNADRDVLDPENVLQGDKPENIRKTVFEKDGKNFAVTREMV